MRKYAKALGALTLAAAAAISPMHTAMAQPADNLYQWPDLGTGVWLPDASALFGGGPKMKVKPEIQAIMTENRARLGGSGTCVPVGTVKMIRTGMPLKFFFSPDAVLIMSDMDDMMFRQVFMDGRDHPGSDDIIGSYFGHSVGHWEDGSLVIDTVGFIEDSELPITPQTHVTERYTWLEPNHMRLVLRVEDPGTLEEPFENTIDYYGHPDWDLQEFYCIEANNRSRPAADGTESVDLTPPE